MPRDDDQLHPVLSEKEDHEQRGDNPPGSFGHTEPASGDLDPNWKPNDDVKNAAEELIKGLGREHRPRREDVYPYLMIRAYSPGDRGVRPTWPPTPCWESPDILLIDAAYTGPFTPGQLVVSPTAGRRYRVFVRIWNLGLLPAIGVVTSAPGTSTPASSAATRTTRHTSRISSAARWSTSTTAPVRVRCRSSNWTGRGTSPRRSPGTSASWRRRRVRSTSGVGRSTRTTTGTSASATSPSSRAATTPSELLFNLGTMVTNTGTLEIIHGGAAVVPLLLAVLGTAPGPRRARRPGYVRRRRRCGGGCRWVMQGRICSRCSAPTPGGSWQTAPEYGRWRSRSASSKACPTAGLTRSRRRWRRGG